MRLHTNLSPVKVHPTEQQRHETCEIVCARNARERKKIETNNKCKKEAGHTRRTHKSTRFTWKPFSYSVHCRLGVCWAQFVHNEHMHTHTHTLKWWYLSDSALTNQITFSKQRQQNGIVGLNIEHRWYLRLSLPIPRGVRSSHPCSSIETLLHCILCWKNRNWSRFIQSTHNSGCVTVGGGGGAAAHLRQPLASLLLFGAWSCFECMFHRSTIFCVAHFNGAKKKKTAAAMLERRCCYICKLQATNKNPNDITICHMLKHSMQYFKRSLLASSQIFRIYYNNSISPSESF